MIGTMNINIDITEEDINPWATVANEFSWDFSNEEIKPYAKRKESPVFQCSQTLKTIFQKQMQKQMQTNADAKKLFSISFCIQWVIGYYVVERLEQQPQIRHLNKVNQHIVYIHN